MYIPLMEKACGRVHFLDEFFYLYNAGTGLNDATVDWWGQTAVVEEVRQKAKE
jgi:hypothetical protein